MPLQCFWTLFTVPYLVKTHNISDTELCFVLRLHLLSWSQSTELVPISRQQRQIKVKVILRPTVSHPIVANGAAP
jgi:hypothetical protein